MRCFTSFIYPRSVLVGSTCASVGNVFISGNATFVALNNVLKAPLWLAPCILPRHAVTQVNVITVGRTHSTYNVRIEHCNCAEHSFVSYLLYQRLFPLTFKEPTTALTFELMDHFDQVAEVNTHTLISVSLCLYT